VKYLASELKVRNQRVQTEALKGFEFYNCLKCSKVGPRVGACDPRRCWGGVVPPCCYQHFDVFRSAVGHPRSQVFHDSLFNKTKDGGPEEDLSFPAVR
jgi:hypothetical protein